MTYLRGFDYDVFVSYAHVDNIAIEPADHGWVDALVRILDSALSMKMGRSNLAVLWRDEQDLRGNHEVTEYIPDQVRRSALFLMVLSPGYLSSTFCQKELDSFLEDNPANRVFVVCKDPIDSTRQTIPAAISDLRKFNFWTPDRHQKPRVLGWPLPQHDSAGDRQLYYPKVEDLSADIVAALDEIATTSGAPPASGARRVVRREPRKGTVLLAEVTDDLEVRREEVRRYLDQAGIRSLPQAAYRLARPDFEQGFASDLTSCAAFVQLLGPYAGKAPPDVPEGFTRLQLNLARARKIPILQWRSPDLDLNGITAANHLSLLQSEGVQATPFEEFKRSVVNLFTAPPPPALIERAPFLFVHAASVDLAQAESLVTSVGEGLDWSMPFYDPNAKAEDTESETDAQLVDCDMLVVLYGEAGPRWVMSQLQHYRKLVPQRTKQPRLLALVKAPPEPKPQIPMNLRGLRTLSMTEAAEQIRATLAS